MSWRPERSGAEPPFVCGSRNKRWLDFARHDSPNMSGYTCWEPAWHRRLPASVLGGMIAPGGVFQTRVGVIKHGMTSIANAVGSIYHPASAPDFVPLPLLRDL